MFDIDNPKLIWVDPSATDGVGSGELPFNTIKQALAKVEPGQTIVLKEGIYNFDSTFEKSGTTLLPIKITANTDAHVEIFEGCWYLYDTSDLIISNITFKNAPHGAISIIGNCKRNRFENINFINCGTEKKTSCTLYFGGSGGQCNVVENCTFERPIQQSSPNPNEASIALMVSEGDTDSGIPLTNHIFRRNTIRNYEYGILVGTNDTSINDYGHIIEYNLIESCSLEGVLIKCSDTLARGNCIKNCSGNSIAVMGGNGTILEYNRIQDCKNGIHARGFGHSILNNCIIRCENQGIRALGKNEFFRVAENLLIVSNTLIHCGSASVPSLERIAGIQIDAETSSLIQKNLIVGEGLPYKVPVNQSDSLEQSSHATKYIVKDNAVSGKCEVLDGVIYEEVRFPNQSKDNYENESVFGATGWVLKPETFDPDIDLVDEDEDYLDPKLYPLEEDDDDSELSESNSDYDSESDE